MSTNIIVPTGKRLSSDSLYTPYYTPSISWQDATDLTTYTPSFDDTVGQWRDKKGNGVNLEQFSSLLKPRANIRTHNTLPVLDFNGSQFMHNTVYSVPASGNLAIFIFAQVDSTNSPSDSIASMNGATYDFQLDASGGSITNDWFGAIDGANIVSPSPLFLNFGANDKAYNGPSLYNANFDWDGGIVNMFVDGTKETNDGTYLAKLDTVQDFAIFANRGDTVFPNGMVGEVLVIEDCSLACRQRIEGYFAWKWGFVLPALHPFKYRPPFVGADGA